MRALTTAILGAVALALALLIYSVDQKPEEGPEEARRANVLVRFDPDLIDRITVKKADGKTVMEKKNGFWFFISPELDRMDPGKARRLLDQLNHLSIVDELTVKEITESPELNREKIGLGESRALHIELSGPAKKGGKERREHSFVLGGVAPLTNSIYAQKEGEQEVFVVAGNPLRFLENPLDEIRDRRLLGVPVEGIVQMLINSSKGEIALQRRVTRPRTNWALLRPLKTRADKDRMDQLLADLRGLQIEKVVKGSEGALKIPSPLPDKAAVIQIVVFGMKKPLTIFLREKEKPAKKGTPPLLEARISDRPFTYLIRSSLLEKMPTSTDDLRDRHLARLPIQNLLSITIQSRIDPLVYMQSEHLPDGRIRWDVKVGNKLLPANLDGIKKLVAGLNNTAIIKFVSNSAEKITEYGLDPPARQILFKIIKQGPPAADGKPGPPITAVRSLKLGWKEGDEQRLYANFEGEPYVYELDPSLVSLIPTHPIKWRSLKVMTFNAFHLKKIIREIPGSPVMELKYDYKQDKWEAKRGKDDLTASLDIGSVRKLRDHLGSFSATSWYLSLAKAYEALKTPSAKFTIITSELDPATNGAKEVTRVLKLARATKELYFGQIEGSPDVFFVDRKTYAKLIQPVTAALIQTP